LFEDEINHEEGLKLTDDHKKILDDRKAKYLTGKDKGSSWQDAHNNIRRKRKSNGV
jgi:hypothetical protein